jgi:glycerophosphoryl diester phosphodiesterase
VKANTYPMRIIGHRGAAGLELENTLASFKHAIALGVDAIEFDVHRTRDGQFVVCHDPHLSRVSVSRAAIKDLNYRELASIELHNGQSVPRLREVLALCQSKQIPAIVELKIDHHLEQFCSLLDEFAGHNITVASFHHAALEQIRRLRPQLPLYLAESVAPIVVVQRARAMRAAGIDLNVNILNPLVYWLARRAQLDIMVYTVDHPLLARYVRLFYPGVQVCTNLPTNFIGEQASRPKRFRPILQHLRRQCTRLLAADFRLPDDQPLER